MKILIIEDETRAANRLQKLVLEIDPSIEIVQITDSIVESVAFLNEQKVDLILSDIQLADGLSFEIYKQVEINCPIIFTTAYDQYAISAFETKGIDYILKPIEKSRLEQSFNKFKDLNTKQDIDIDALKSLISKNQEVSYKKRFRLKLGIR
jgi:two-component SAPR family response regulator